MLLFLVVRHSCMRGVVFGEEIDEYHSKKLCSECHFLPLLSVSLSRFLSSSSYGSINCTVLIEMLVLLPLNVSTRSSFVRGMYLVVCMNACCFFDAVTDVRWRGSVRHLRLYIAHCIPSTTAGPTTSSASAAAGRPRRRRAGPRPRPRRRWPRPTRTRCRRWRWWW